MSFKCKLLSFNRENIFLKNLHHPTQDRLKYVNCKKRLAHKNHCFSTYVDMVMTYINFPVYFHTEKFIKEIGFL